MSDLVIPIRKDRNTGLYFVKLPQDFYGLVGNPKMRVSLKTHNLMEAQERLGALAIVAQLSNKSIGEF